MFEYHHSPVQQNEFHRSTKLNPQEKVLCLHLQLIIDYDSIDVEHSLTSHWIWTMIISLD